MIRKYITFYEAFEIANNSKESENLRKEICIKTNSSHDDCLNYILGNGRNPITLENGFLCCEKETYPGKYYIDLINKPVTTTNEQPKKCICEEPIEKCSFPNCSQSRCCV